FSGPTYGADFSIPTLGDGFTELGTVEVLVNNDLFLTSAETGGFLADGIYDWIEILASTTIDVCPSGSTCPPDSYTPGSPVGTEDGQEWTLAIFGASDWFADGSVIPDSLPVDYQALLVGLNFNDNGVEVGAAFATSSVPLPAAIWLFGSGLLGLIGIARHKKA
ncbi:MAG: VPLPA-CTERM sorting domain-containing protein, partial [Gammaproteobacteria bacterium]